MLCCPRGVTRVSLRNDITYLTVRSWHTTVSHTSKHGHQCQFRNMAGQPVFIWEHQRSHESGGRAARWPGLSRDIRVKNL